MQVPFAKPRSSAARPRRSPRSSSPAGSRRARACRRSRRRSPRASAPRDAIATTNCTTALHLALYVVGRRPGRRGDRPVAVVHRHRQRGLALRRDAGVRRHRPAHLQPRPASPPSGRSRRARRRSCRSTRSACRPTWTRSSRSAASTALAIVEDAACAIGAELQGPADRLARPARLLLAAPAQGHHDRRGRHDHHERRRARRRACASCASTRWTSPTSRATARRTSSSSRYPERGWNCRMTDMQAALGLCQLEALDEILAERARARPSATTRRSARSPHLETPYEPDVRRAHLAVLRGARRPRRRRRPHRADAPAAARRHRDAPRRDGDPPRGGLRRRRPAAAAHRGGGARRADAAAVPGARRRAAGLRDRAARPPT